MQTISFLLLRLQESGLRSQDIFFRKAMETEKKLELFLHPGKKMRIRNTDLFLVNTANKNL